MNVILISNYWTNLIKLLTIILILTLMTQQVNNTIIKAPWSDPNINPCANYPNGWQLIYWKPLQMCFKIFTLGYPCPDTKELVPAENSLKLMQINGIHSVCKCPPGTAEYLDICFQIYRKGPCQLGEYITLIEKHLDNSTKIITGTCKKFYKCPTGKAYAPQFDDCIQMYTKDFCPKGKLIFSENDLAICKCKTKGLRYYYDTNYELCYEHYTRGPCKRKGLLYLPGGKCGCKPYMPQYNLKTGQCYELGTQGPCAVNSIYTVSLDDESKFRHGKCVCKNGYVRWLVNGLCYPLYSTGPCLLGHFIVNGTKCIKIDCNRGELYFPRDEKCYEVGTQGPCSDNQVFTVDYRVRSLIDGHVTYNGICNCLVNDQCTKPNKLDINKDCNVDGMGKINGICYKLYSRGPCNYNEWVQPYTLIDSNNTAKCKCQWIWTNFADNTCN